MINDPMVLPKPPSDGPQTQPGAVGAGLGRAVGAAQPPRFGKMARAILGQKFNRSIPSGASRGGAIATGIGGILDNAVDGWNAKRYGEF